MNNPPQFRRGDGRIASCFLTALVTMTLTGVLPLASPEAFTVRLSIGASGFEPRRIAVPLGLVHFVVTSREGDHCFAVPSLDVEKRVRASRPLEVNVTFERAGEIPFLCCVESPGTAETGVIVVTPGK